MKILRYFLLLMAAVTMAAGFTACINDDISTSPSDQPTFSVDTLKMGTVFTEDVTVTHKFTVRNRNDKGINISDIRLSGPNADLFRLNVDGLAGKTFQNVEIRANDSIYVFVEATLPANGGTTPQTVNATVDFLTNGVTSHVVLRADGQDVTRLRALTITEDTHLTKGRPYQIFDSLVVAEGRTLTLDPGADLRFHDGATFIVRGTLICNGTLRDPVSIAGDRTGNVITDITFDLMSRQWNGLQFTVSSHGNRMVHTHLRNTWYGVIVSGDGKPSADGAPKLWLQNTRLRNSGDLVLEVYDADVQAYGCEFAEAANGVVRLQGGSHIFNHCTFANYYLFSAIGGAALTLEHLSPENDAETGTPYTKALISNSIIYGLGPDISPGDLLGTEVTLNHCLLRSNGTDDDNFIACLWDKDPLYYTVREDYIFDYRVKPESPAIGAGDPALTLPDAAVDAYGLTRSTTAPTLGAYVYQPPVE
ncbi:MAG: hypothetical protein MRZ32_06090 [Bacteroidales bacterium]|nr:hypothetical protein [Bacteroidales bacterium]MDY2917197.1 hypothetical protein [Muribaculaceae bacterium]